MVTSEMKANNKHKWDDPATVALADEVVDICEKECENLYFTFINGLKSGLDLRIPSTNGVMPLIK